MDMKQGQTEPVTLPKAVTGAPLAIELRHLRYFVALADAGSFTHAAEQMFIAQPTLSQQIRRLEEIVGTQLLQRRREGLQLTKAGAVLLDASRTVLSLVDHEVDRTRQAAGLGRPRLRVVVPSRLPAALATEAAPAPQPAAAPADRPTAVLTGPSVIAGSHPGLIRLPRPMFAHDMIRVGLEDHPLTATAALVWNGDLPRPLQQILFDAADGIASPDRPGRRVPT